MSLADEIKKINDDKVTVPLNCFDELIALALDAIATSTYETIKKQILSEVSSSNKKIISGEVGFVISQNGRFYKNENNVDNGYADLIGGSLGCSIPFGNNISNIEQLKIAGIKYNDKVLFYHIPLRAELEEGLLMSKIFFSTAVKDIESKMLNLADADKVKIKFGACVKKYAGKNSYGLDTYEEIFCVEGQKVGLRSKLYRDSIVIRYEYVVS